MLARLKRFWAFVVAGWRASRVVPRGPLPAVAELPPVPAFAGSILPGQKRHRVLREVHGRIWAIVDGTDPRAAADALLRVKRARSDGVCRWQEDDGAGWRDRDVYRGPLA